MKKKQSQSIDQQIDARKKAINETFAEITQTIEDYLHAAPLAFIEGHNAEPGQYVFSQQGGRFAHWMGVLYPRTVEYQQKIQAGKGHGSLLRRSALCVSAWLSHRLAIDGRKPR